MELYKKKMSDVGNLSLSVLNVCVIDDDGLVLNLIYSFIVFVLCVYSVLLYSVLSCSIVRLVRLFVICIFAIYLKIFAINCLLFGRRVVSC